MQTRRLFNNEKELIQQILAGNPQAVSYFYRQFKPRITNIVSQKLPSENVDEVVQDVFLSSLASLSTFAGRSSLYSWLVSITRHEIADFYRKKKIKEVVFSKLPFLKKIIDKALSPETAFEEKELKEKVKHTFSSLSEGYRQILRLKYIDGQSIESIAKQLGISYKTCESRLFRARIAFQKLFVQNNPGYKNRSFNNLKRRLSFLP
jgi:RNA polymerase sigma-70 factor (ECF subfamily)